MHTFISSISGARPSVRIHWSVRIFRGEQESEHTKKLQERGDKSKLCHKYRCEGAITKNRARTVALQFQQERNTKKLHTVDASFSLLFIFDSSDENKKITTQRKIPYCRDLVSCWKRIYL